MSGPFVQDLTPQAGFSRPAVRPPLAPPALSGPAALRGSIQTPFPPGHLPRRQTTAENGFTVVAEEMFPPPLVSGPHSPPYAPDAGSTPCFCPEQNQPPGRPGVPPPKPLPVPNNFFRGSNYAPGENIKRIKTTTGP